MTDTYGALQAGSNDAGSWQLIEQGDTGEWAPLARGGKNNIVKLAQLLNTAEDLLEKQTDPAIRAANLEAVRDNESLYEQEKRQRPNTTPSRPDPATAAGTTRDVGGQITAAEVEGWDYDTYLQHRARLYYLPRGGGQEYRDGSEFGRPYSTPAARMMTGPREAHPAYRGYTSMAEAAEAARDLAQTWQAARGGRLQREIRAQWSGLAAQLDLLANQWADRAPRP